MEDGIKEVKKDWFNRFFVIVVPVGLVFATIVGIIVHIVTREDEGQDVSRRLPRKISEAEIADIQTKLSDFLGDRGFETDKTRKNLQAARNLIAGSLSPENAGYAIRDGQSFGDEGLLFRPVWVDLEGKKKHRVIRVINRMDGNDQDAAATAVALSIAQALAADVPPVSIRFLFLTGLEEFPLKISTKKFESYPNTLWIGHGAPDGVTALEIDSAQAFEGAIQARDALDLLMIK